MHKLTSQPDMKYKLFITIAMMNNLREYAIYHNFKVRSERDDFKLDFDGIHGSSGRIRVHNLIEGRKFQTWDHGYHTESKTRGNCANYTNEVGGGGWWFKDNPYCTSTNCRPTSCGYSNLNAKVPYWRFMDIKGVQMELLPM